MPGIGPIDVSMVDAADACAFVRARDIGLTGRELPDELERDPRFWKSCRRSGVRRRSRWASPEMTPRRAPSPPCRSSGSWRRRWIHTLSGEPIAVAQVDLTARFLSNGEPHRALPLTASLCTAVAARISGTLVAEALAHEAGDRVRIGMPLGILTVGADVGQEAGGQWVARSGAFYRTARRLSTAASTCHARLRSCHPCMIANRQCEPGTQIAVRSGSQPR